MYNWLILMLGLHKKSQGIIGGTELILTTYVGGIVIIYDDVLIYNPSLMVSLDSSCLYFMLCSVC